MTPAPTRPGVQGPTVADVGEFGLIAAITAGLAPTASVPVTVGDDCAVLAPTGRLAVSTDSMVEDVHFRRQWSSARDVGRKAVASAMADVVAMGARPLALVVAVVLPPDLPAAWAQELGVGIRQEADLCGAVLAGGDTAGGEKIVVAVTVFGDLEGRTPILRSGARPGQVVAYIGNLGMAEAGLTVLRRGFRSPAAVVNAHRVPAPPYDQGIVAAEAGATAMIDCSDGLVADLRHLAEASGVVIAIETENLAVAEPQQTVAAAIGRADPLDFVLRGGDDHALLATFEPGRVPAGWTVIGGVAAADGDPGVLVDGAPFTATEGWKHF
nr:thiamine-phosphate kinase [Propionibacterium sp.]